MRRAYDTILFDYVDAYTAARNGGFEQYRYLCAYCWEEVRLCAADSSNQATHFRHRSGNNNVECEKYLGNRSAVLHNALSCRNVRDKIEFYFSNDKKMFSIGIKFSAEEIASYEHSNTCFQLSRPNVAKPIFSIPIRSGRFLPDIFEVVPITEFSWEYFCSFTTKSGKRKYELFRKDKRGYLNPMFLKMRTSDDDSSFQAKLIRTNTLYINTLYLMISAHQHCALSFMSGVKIGKQFEFQTMGKTFWGVSVTFVSKTSKIDEQLATWNYSLEVNETLSVLWPPTSQVDEVSFITTQFAYIYSSFDMQAHGNINVDNNNITRLSKGVTKIAMNEQVKIYYKNTELLLAKDVDKVTEFDVLCIKQEIFTKYTAQDSTTYLFGSDGVKPMSRGMSVSLTKKSKIHHYSFGYLDCIITAPNRTTIQDKESLLYEVLMYYRRKESFNRNDFEALDLSPVALQYIELCEKTGMINSAVKYFIQEGRI